MKENLTYFQITGNFNVDELINIIGVEPDNVVYKGEIFLSRKAKKNMLIYGINKDINMEINERLYSSIKKLIPVEELLGKIKDEMKLRYYLNPGDWNKGELLIVPFEIARFLNITYTFRNLDYYFF